MFLDWWMLVVLAIVTGIWSEYRWYKGISQGATSTIMILADQNLIKIGKNGEVVGLKLTRK